MMDKKTILDNGLLEQYILGELNAQECEQIEHTLASDIELKAQFDALEKDFETLGLENAIEPATKVKTQLLENIKSDSNKTNVIEINPKSNSKWYLGIAASVTAFLILGGFWMYNEMSNVKQQLQTVEKENTELNDKLKNLNKQLEYESALFATLTHPDTKQYVLKGNTLMPDGKVISYVNHNTKSVVINTERLPKLDDAHDYQMWADVEGEMINMGVIAKDKNLITMEYIDHAESFNITIEPAGGNDHPTVERLISNVYL
ncbi:anti-sigma factor domain-containing protein [Winogradskyella sp.]|uniref:anti-sigma factor domain-containing protein n=1 Tax=Winogradskyella sp. TaxID=1883156 RepID=UPI003512CCEF